MKRISRRLEITQLIHGMDYLDWTIGATRIMKTMRQSENKYTNFIRLPFASLTQIFNLQKHDV